MKRLLRHPLLHFLLVGGALVGVDLVTGGAEPPTGERVIVVDGTRLDRLRTRWRERAGREPSEEEVRGVVAAFVEDEVLYREAIARGMHDGDLAIRQRLVQKMRYLVRDLATIQPPTEPELDAYLSERPERYPGDREDSPRRARSDLLAERKVAAEREEVRRLMQRYQVRRAPELP